MIVVVVLVIANIYSGYMPLMLEEKQNQEGSFFFFLAMQRKAKRVKGKEKLLIWLNGGPVRTC
jgi:carboxypeptidase C (cathepsin A)